MMRKILFYIFFFIFFFSIEFAFFPIRIRWILSIFGILLLVKDYKTKVKLPFSRQWKRLIKLSISLIFVAMISSVVNGVFDIHFYKEPFKILISLSSSYAFFYIIKKFFNVSLTVDNYIKLMLHACVIQICISIIGFINEGFLNFALSIMKVDALFIESAESYSGGMGRIIGIGASFFGAGCLYALVATLSAIIIKKETNPKHQAIYIVEVLFVIVVGMAIARTSILGLFGFLFILFGYDLRHNIKRILIGLSVVTLVFWVFAKFLIIEIENSVLFGEAFNRAFSMFYAYKEYGELQSMQSMVGHSILPSSIKTWIIGDGLMADPTNPSLAYYMNQDRGWNRLVFGIGVLGGLVYTAIQYVLCRLTGFRKLEVFVLFLYYCAFMVKGLHSHDVILSPIIMLIVFNIIQNYKLEKSTLTKHNYSKS